MQRWRINDKLKEPLSTPKHQQQQPKITHTHTQTNIKQTSSLGVEFTWTMFLWLMASYTFICFQLSFCMAVLFENCIEPWLVHKSSKLKKFQSTRTKNLITAVSYYICNHRFSFDKLTHVGYMYTFQNSSLHGLSTTTWEISADNKGGKGQTGSCVTASHLYA